MVNSKKIVAALACLGIAGVNAGPCKPHTTTSSTETAVSATSELSLSVSGSTSAEISVTETSSSTISSETELATESTSGTQTTAVTETGTSTVTSAIESMSSHEPSTTSGAPYTTSETTTTAATTASSAPVTPCNNKIYRGRTRSLGYKTTEASTDQECYEACFSEQTCNAWWFYAVGSCHLYTEELSDFGTPVNEEDNLMGSRNCSPDDYTPCNDEIGFGYISKSPIGQTNQVQVELKCAQLCMKNGQCTVWQYDSLSQTCNMFTGSFTDVFTAETEAPQGSKIALAGSRSCSSDFFKPQLGPCNGQIGFHAEALSGYRTFPQYNSVALCARACSIDPVCLSWGVFDGNSDCTFSQYPYYEEWTDICAAGSRNCGVP
ncbi:hypothetical protein FSARC_12568 [Fusarium sarcochroum]|uniref:Apple domain-containing protein n=1 Tax=Fusarium sarcochroum TaxID=1208366 RepID=A0A8H4T7X5_9HYPO|nr:hypothetical protein FSARC_12568 [Fusarium sarcochroum]